MTARKSSGDLGCGDSRNGVGFSPASSVVARPGAATVSGADESKAYVRCNREG